MRVSRLAFALAIALTLSVCTSTKDKAEDASSPTQARGIADRVVDDMAAERFAEVEAVVAPEAKDTLSADKVKSVWASALKDVGTYKSSGSPLTSKTEEYELFDYPLTFERGNAHLQVAVGKQGQVVGLYLRPGAPTGKFGG